MERRDKIKPDAEWSGFGNPPSGFSPLYFYQEIHKYLSQKGMYVWGGGERLISVIHLHNSTVFTQYGGYTLNEFPKGFDYQSVPVNIKIYSSDHSEADLILEDILNNVEGLRDEKKD